MRKIGVLKSPPSDPLLNVSLAVHSDGRLSIGNVTFVGTISTAEAGIPLDGINALDVAAPQPSCPKALEPGPTVEHGVTLITPDMGEVVLQDSRNGDANSNYVIRDAVLITAHQSSAHDTFVVDTVAETAELRTIPQLATDQVALLTSKSAEADDSAAWVLANLAVGVEFTAHGELSDATITDLIGGPASRSPRRSSSCSRRESTPRSSSTAEVRAPSSRTFLRSPGRAPATR
nr:hypothetical protein [Microbacterium sp. 18062]